MSELVHVTDGDVIEVTKRYKIVGVEGPEECPDVLAMQLYDGEPRGWIHRWDGGIVEDAGIDVEVKKE